VKDGQEDLKSEVTDYAMLHNLCIKGGYISLPQGSVVINNDDGCDKAHTMTVTFFYVARDQYGEVATDKWTSSSFALVSLWYHNLPICLNPTADIP
jgi:hypothetical protein